MLRLPSAMSDASLNDMVALARTTPPGPFVEVGVWQGGSAQRLYEVAQEQRRATWLFDTFTGIPFADPVDIHKVGDFNGVDLEAIRLAMPKANIVKGIFPASLGPRPDSIAFIHEDTDQYRSTRSVIVYLWPRLVPGGIILFDDYNTSDCPGSRRAIDEAREWFGFELRPIRSKVYAVKER